MKAEMIVCSAILNDSAPPIMICGLRHNDCLKTNHILDIDESGFQGFLTTENRFVDRKEALRIAIQSGQVKEGRTHSNGILFSEDLY